MVRLAAKGELLFVFALRALRSALHGGIGG
jgi:hypothetical protein